MPHSITLRELNEEIKQVLNNNLQISYWVTGEISELKENANGHCYLELIQKDDDTERIIARNRAIIWSNNYRMIKAYFETTTRQLFIPGISIMVNVNVEYHEVYGLSLTIFDIEPVYTVGELEIRKQKILEQLTEEGVIYMNKELEFPVIPKNLAVISSKTAAGYEDFRKQLSGNSMGFKFTLKIFPAIMQGKETEASITSALDRIYEYEQLFDCVIIIRGGGSQSDLNCFNSYQIANHIAQFPLPVITGIGHEQDDTITDIVAHTRLKTPTAVAEFLIDIFSERLTELAEFTDIITLLLTKKLQTQKQNLVTKGSKIIQLTKDRYYCAKSDVRSTGEKLRFAVRNFDERRYKSLSLFFNKLESRSSKHLLKSKYTLTGTEDDLNIKIQSIIQRNHHLLEINSEAIKNLNPLKVLERGYSITMKQGKVIKSGKELEINDQIETLFLKGKIKSSVTDKK